MDRHAHTAAHHDAINQCNVGYGQRGNGQAVGVFHLEEAHGVRCVAVPQLQYKCLDIPTSTECLQPSKDRERADEHAGTTRVMIWPGVWAIHLCLEGIGGGMCAPRGWCATASGHVLYPCMHLHWAWP